jgi:hypothetical protein
MFPRDKKLPATPSIIVFSSKPHGNARIILLLEPITELSNMSFPQRFWAGI